jgi:hypothetical protein
MSSLRLKHFANTSTLRAVRLELLIAFLERHRDYLDSRGLRLDTAETASEAFYEHLITILLTPDDDTPPSLSDALFLVNEMSTDQGMIDLSEAVREAGIQLDIEGDLTAADLAMVVWLQAPHVLEYTHDEQKLLKTRSFEYFQARTRRRTRFRIPNRATLEKVERSINDWLEKHYRGRTAYVHIYERPGEVWFRVRHGETCKREECFRGTQPSSVTFRPLSNDTLVYQPEIGELRIHAGLASLTDLYITCFGEYLFDDPDHFPKSQKYTLAPLRDGPDCLRCSDIPGMEWVRLREVRQLYAGSPALIVIRKSDDLFKAMLASSAWLEGAGRPIQASFLVKFKGCRSPRAVIVRPSNIAQYTRDNDSAPLEEWFKARCFIREERLDSCDEPEAILAGH